MLNPIALHREYLPPTQSQNSNIFSGSIPNSVTAFVFVERAAKCLAISAGSPPFHRNHFFALSAFVMVSWVVKVLDAMRKSVVSGLSFLRVSAI